MDNTGTFRVVTQAQYVGQKCIESFTIYYKNSIPYEDEYGDEHVEHEWTSERDLAKEFDTREQADAIASMFPHASVRGSRRFVFRTKHNTEE